MRKRSKIENEIFKQHADTENQLLEIVDGQKDIRKAVAENYFKSKWDLLQKTRFQTNQDWSSLSQLQVSGASFLNELKSVIITVISAMLVLENQFTLGTMMSIAFIVGQLSWPVMEVLIASQQYQSTSLAYRRLENFYSHNKTKYGCLNLCKGDITIQNVSFKYSESNLNVLNNINLVIPQYKTTAIVGASGSGKTTFLKLLVREIEGYNGVIKFGKTNQLDISETSWNKSIASVLEDSYLFTATVERNIALNDPIDTNKLQHCIKLSNLENFIDGLANGLNTLLDPNGENISTGEKQRILLARALYRDADYLFLDEITSAQDVLNERVILENLSDIATKKTVIVITHRLNTIINADLILMFEKGMIVESGTHEELISKNGKYFSFISSQSNIAQEI